MNTLSQPSVSRCSHSYPILAPEVSLFQDSHAPLLLISRQKEITQRWQTLLQCLQEQKKQIAGTQAVLSLLQEVEATTDQLGELQVGRSAELWEVLSLHACSQIPSA